jgi:hypothetical protein
MPMGVSTSLDTNGIEVLLWIVALTRTNGCYRHASRYG